MDTNINKCFFRVRVAHVVESKMVRQVVAVAARL